MGTIDNIYVLNYLINRQEEEKKIDGMFCGFGNVDNSHE